MGTWNAYGNEYWPADYLIDADGQVRYAAFGEGDYDKTETAIRALLAEAGDQRRRHEPPDRRDRAQRSRRRRRPISAPARAQGWVERPEARDARLRLPRTGAPRRSNDFAFSGTWNDRRPARATAVAERRHRRRVPGQERLPRAELGRRNAPRPVQVLLDGHPISRRRTPAPMCTAASSRSAASACTRSSRCPASERHRLVAALRAGRHRLRVHVRVAGARGVGGRRTPATIFSCAFCVFWGRTCGRCACPRTASPSRTSRRVRLCTLPSAAPAG